MSSLLPYQYIAVEGNIGAGKTSLAKIFSNRFATNIALESFAENTFLPQFYENPERFAFPLEMSFLAERYGQLKQEQEAAFSAGVPLISDYIFEKSMLFARVNLTSHELDLFERFFHLIHAGLRRPDLIVFLNKKTVNLKSNIAKRGRDYEKSIPDAYLDKVTQQYLQHLEAQGAERILMIESDQLDFVNNPSDLRFLAELVAQDHAVGVHHIKP